MSEVTQIPGELDIRATTKDDLTVSLDFDISLIGYTFASRIINSSNGDDVVGLVTNTDLANGQISLTFTKEQLTALPIGTHNWYLEWITGGLSRRILAGDFFLISYP